MWGVCIQQIKWAGSLGLRPWHDSSNTNLRTACSTHSSLVSEAITELKQSFPKSQTTSYSSLESGSLVILLLLDLGAAFHTINRSILLCCLQSFGSLGLPPTCLTDFTAFQSKTINSTLHMESLKAQCSVPLFSFCTCSHLVTPSSTMVYTSIEAYS